MQISIIKRREIYGALGASSALTYFYGRNVALAAISSFVVAKIIDYMQKRKILSVTQEMNRQTILAIQEEHRNESSTLKVRLNRKQQKAKNRLSQKLIATTEKLRATEILLSEIEDGDQVEKARTIIEQQEQLQELQDTQSHLQHHLYEARRIIENLNGKIRELKNQLGFTHSQLLKERERNANR